MTEDTAELLLVLLIAAGLLIRSHPVAISSEQQPHPRPDLESSLLLLLTLGTMIIVPVIDFLVPWFEFADFLFIDDLAVIGLVVGLAAITLFFQAQSALAKTPGSTTPNFVTNGVYRYMRHPMYTAMFLWALAQVLLLQNWLAGPAAAITFMLVYALRVPREEQKLLERFGHRYVDYMTDTGGLFPRWHRRRQ